MKTQKKNVLYCGIFLSESSTNHLQFWWKQNIGDLLPDVLCHHVTFGYKPFPFEITYYSRYLGNLYQINVDSFAQTSSVQCVGISKCVVSANGINDVNFVEDLPLHITVAIDKNTGAKPKDSIKLLDNKIQVKGPQLHGRFGFMMTNQKICHKM